MDFVAYDCFRWIADGDLHWGRHQRFGKITPQTIRSASCGTATGQGLAVAHAISHEVPDYPIQNLDVARRGLETHRACAKGCEAKRYFAALVPHLEMIARRRAASAGWNLWRQG
ncbi:hypothetical protein [Nocardia seriolae]|uniref:hypothetical protein n=1 Tax=Nocardia seriolae TaxID=37332 RepID=UPI0011609A20|nr:hypothetical protein [Nocardia seriolae]MTJ64798.1 hypothetical protein [Nocardia seriolae]MTJ72423.1 hypothetical protein [Nocardia seriolae]MTJ89633.1 hypothetical protein [Nocardia seriolae]MTK33608.1 hypothetical protein [Nocardia seriolae]MTK42757.1 hypothetical protein [Nocardia seriolae]